MYHFKYDEEYTNSKLKGIVIDKDTQTVVCTTSVHTVEYDVTNIDDIPYINDIDWKNSLVMVSEEGCFLRVYNHNDNWYISTHRKLDADNSKWGSKYSFKTLFLHALDDLIYDENEPKISNIDEDFFDKLDKNYVYTFLLRNNISNRIVCNSPVKNEPKLYFTGVYPLGDRHDYVPKFIPLNINIPAVEIVPCKDIEELKNFVNKMSNKRHQGVIVFSKVDGITTVFKIMCKDYLELKEIRNNCPNLIYRYAQIRDDLSMRNKILDLFPQFSYDFFNFENIVNKIAQHICNQYILRYVKKQHAEVTSLQYKITKKLRKWYLENHYQNRVNPEVVSKFIEEESYSYIYKLVVEYEENSR